MGKKVNPTWFSTKEWNRNNAQMLSFEVILIKFHLLYKGAAMPVLFWCHALAWILLGMHLRRLKIHPFHCKAEIDVSAAMLDVLSSQWRRWEELLEIFTEFSSVGLSVSPLGFQSCFTCAHEVQSNA